MHSQENTLFDLDLNVTQNCYAHTKFEVAMYNGLGAATIIRMVTNRRTHRQTDGRPILVGNSYNFFSKEKSRYIYPRYSLEIKTRFIFCQETDGAIKKKGCKWILTSHEEVDKLAVVSCLNFPYYEFYRCFS